MKVQHITLGGNSVVRDTASILDTTRKKLDVVRFSYESGITRFYIPDFPFAIETDVSKEGTIFDIMKGGLIAVINYCCFEKENKNEILSLVGSLEGEANLQGLEPITDQWLYSVPVNLTSPQEIMLAEEIELYIYEQLYLAYHNDRKRAQ